MRDKSDNGIYNAFLTKWLKLQISEQNYQFTNVSLVKSESTMS